MQRRRPAPGATRLKTGDYHDFLATGNVFGAPRQLRHAASFCPRCPCSQSSPSISFSFFSLRTKRLRFERPDKGAKIQITDCHQLFDVPRHCILVEDYNDIAALLFDDFHAHWIIWVWIIIPGLLPNEVHGQIVYGLHVCRKDGLPHVLADIIWLRADHHVESVESMCQLLLAHGHLRVCISLDAIVGSIVFSS
jgi:hypothetical protein